MIILLVLASLLHASCNVVQLTNVIALGSDGNTLYFVKGTPVPLGLPGILYRSASLYKLEGVIVKEISSIGTLSGAPHFSYDAKYLGVPVFKEGNVYAEVYDVKGRLITSKLLGGPRTVILPNVMPTDKEFFAVWSQISVTLGPRGSVASVSTVIAALKAGKSITLKGVWLPGPTAVYCKHGWAISLNTKNETAVVWNWKVYRYPDIYILIGCFNGYPLIFSPKKGISISLDGKKYNATAVATIKGVYLIRHKGNVWYISQDGEHWKEVAKCDKFVMGIDGESYACKMGGVWHAITPIGTFALQDEPRMLFASKDKVYSIESVSLAYNPLAVKKSPVLTVYIEVCQK